MDDGFVILFTNRQKGKTLVEENDRPAWFPAERGLK